MSIEEVRNFFASSGKEVIELKQSSATVELAAQALNTEPARIAKTLSFQTSEGAILIVTAGDVKIDNHKYKDFFHCKAKMLSAEEVLTTTGHAVGGVCPFALPVPAPKVYMDISLQRFKTVFPAAGSNNSAIELTVYELYVFAQARGWVDLCK